MGCFNSKPDMEPFEPKQYYMSQSPALNYPTPGSTRHPMQPYAPPFAHAPAPYTPYEFGQPGFYGQPVAFGHSDASLPHSHGSMGYGGPQHGFAPEPYPAGGYSHGSLGYGGPQHGYAPESYPAGGPTLLQSHYQNQGMSTGGKVALAAAGGVAAGVAGYAVATHMDEIGGASGDAADGVGHFAGEAFEEAGDFMEDMF